MKTFGKSVLALTSTITACLALASLGSAADTKTDEAPAGFRMFYATHSLMWDTPAPFSELATGAGMKNHKIDMQRMGFSRTQQFWDQAEAQSAAKKALKEGNVDVFVMSPMDMPDKGVEGFVTLGIQNNPHMKFYVQNNWAGFNQDGQRARQSMMSGAHPWDGTTEEQLKTLNTVCETAFETQVKEINEKVGHPVLFIIPTSQVNSNLRAMIIRKEFPVLEKQSQLFLDNIGHPTPVLVTLNAYTHYATIYGRSPVGLPMPATLKRANNPKFDEAFNKALQELAWKVVINYPLSGVKAPEKK
jgi:hypothetical protein